MRCPSGALTVAALLIASGCMGSSSSSSEPPRQNVRVPTVTSAWVDAAAPRLHRAGLRISIPHPWAITSFDGPLVFGQEPQPGTRVPAGSVVSFRIGGLLGSPGQKLGRHRVPGVGGENLDEATRDVWAAGLAWRVDATALPPTSTANVFSAYCVSSQRPGGRSVIAIGRNTHQIRMVELHAKPC